MLRRNPIVTATAVLSLAIGIGANTAVFTVANALLFRAPTGVVDADRLVDIGVSPAGRRLQPRLVPNLPRRSRVAPRHWPASSRIRCSLTR